jgi:signal transduction histidine kinase
MGPGPAGTVDHRTFHDAPTSGPLDVAADAAGPPTAPRSTTRGRQPLGAALAREWRELGGAGRIAMVGVVLAAIVSVALGLWIQHAAANHLLEARRELLQALVDDLADAGHVPLGPVRAPPDTVAEAIERKLIGAGVVGVAVIRADGEVVYRSADVPPRADVGTPTRLGTPHAERHDDGLLHFHLPVVSDYAGLLGVFDVHMIGDSFDAAVKRIRRSVWVAILAGLGFLGITMGTLTIANAQVLEDRSRQAERLLQALFWAEEAERERIIGTLHDDVGQHMHGALYGLQAAIAKLSEDEPARCQLRQVELLTREATSILRRELRELHEGVYDDLDLCSALRELIGNAADHLGLDIETTEQPLADLAPKQRSAVLRAAREALVNIRCHAGTDRAWIRVREDGSRLWVEIADDGRGTGGPEGLGLYTARQRLLDAGGGLSVAPRLGGGTLVTAWAPLSGDAT